MSEQKRIEFLRKKNSNLLQEYTELKIKFHDMIKEEIYKEPLKIYENFEREIENLNSEKGRKEFFKFERKKSLLNQIIALILPNTFKERVEEKIDITIAYYTAGLRILEQDKLRNINGLESKIINLEKSMEEVKEEIKTLEESIIDDRKRRCENNENTSNIRFFEQNKNNHINLHELYKNTKGDNSKRQSNFNI